MVRSCSLVNYSLQFISSFGIFFGFDYEGSLLIYVSNAGTSIGDTIDGLRVLFDSCIIVTLRNIHGK